MVIYVCLSFKPLVTTIPGFPGIPSRPDMSNPESRKGRRDETRPTSKDLALACSASESRGAYTDLIIRRAEARSTSSINNTTLSKGAYLLTLRFAR